MGIDVKECSDGTSSSQCEILVRVSDIRRVLKKDDASKGKFYFCHYYIQIILRINVFHHHFYLPEVHIQVQNGHGVLSRLLPCILDMYLTSMLSTPWSFWICISTLGK